MTKAAGAEKSTRLAPLQTPGGRYSMLALDQRESLRAMFRTTDDGAYVDDSALRSFKALGTEILSPFASAVLIDRPFGLTNGRPPGLADGCGLIVAVDVLHQHPGHEITHVTFDADVTTELLDDVGADAVKLLVLWRRGSGKAERAELVERAVERAADAGVASLVEGIVRPDEGKTWRDPAERHDAILACAQELIAFAPDIYKAEVPGYVQGDLSAVAEQSAQMTSIVEGDWVVLSNGVERSAFADAVTEAVRGGARGFLAGRAIWADTVGEQDIAVALRDRSARRLENLSRIVDEVRA